MLKPNDDLRFSHIGGENNKIASTSLSFRDGEESKYYPSQSPPSSSLSYKIKSRGASISNITPRPFARMKVDVNKLMIISSILTQSDVDKMHVNLLILREL
jgi:hypothetical protein